MSFVSVTLPEELVIASDVPVSAPVWVRAPPTSSVMAPPEMPAASISRPSASWNETAPVPLTASELTLLATVSSVTAPVVAVTDRDSATMAFVCVRPPPTVIDTDFPEMPSVRLPIDRLLSSLILMNLPTVFAVAATADASRCTSIEPAAAVSETVVPVMSAVGSAGVASRIEPPAARVIVLPSADRLLTRISLATLAVVRLIEPTVITDVARIDRCAVTAMFAFVVATDRSSRVVAPVPRSSTVMVWFFCVAWKSRRLTLVSTSIFPVVAINSARFATMSATVGEASSRMSW